jgi:hypothetical protein
MDQQAPRKLDYGRESTEDRFLLVRELLLLLGVTIGIITMMALLGRWAQLQGIINVITLPL